MTIHQDIEALQTLFDGTNKTYQYKPYIKLSANTIRRFKKVFPNVPSTLIDFFKTYNGLFFGWSEGKVQVNNLLNVVKGLERDFYTIIHNEPYVALLETQNSKVVCKINADQVQLFFVCAFYVKTNKLREQTLLYPLDLSLEAYLQKAVLYKGVSFWEFLEYPALWNTLNTSVEHATYLEEVQQLFSTSKKPLTDWVSLIQRARQNPYLTINLQTFQTNALPSALQISTELYLAHHIHPAITNYYTQVKRGLELEVCTNNRFYTVLKIASYSELIESSNASVWKYLGISKRSKNKKAYYSYRVFIYKECPVFIDLTSTAPFNLYYYETSEQEVYQIQLSFNQFLSKLFACGGIENWERLFIGKNYVDQEVVDAIKLVNPELDIATFLMV